MLKFLVKDPNAELRKVCTGSLLSFFDSKKVGGEQKRTKTPEGVEPQEQEELGFEEDFGQRS